MLLVIDTDALIECAVEHMDSETDLRWPIGAAMQDLHHDAMQDIFKLMVEKHNANLEKGEIE